MQLHLLSQLALLALLVSARAFDRPSGSGSGSGDASGGDDIFKCIFKHATGQLTCGRITCKVITNIFSHGKVCPPGVYRVGSHDYTKSIPWYNLYPLSHGSYWYNSKVPGLSCEGGFALHGGDYVLGTITVIDDICMKKLAILLDKLSSDVFGAKICKACKVVPDCWWKKCSCGSTIIPKEYITVLYVY